MDVGLLGGLAQGLKSGIEGYQDAQDRKLKRLELESKLKADEAQRERQARLDEIAFSKEFTPKERQEMQFKAGLTGQELSFDEEGNPSFRYREDALRKSRAGSAAANPEVQAIRDLQRRKLEADLEEKNKKRISPIVGYQKTDRYTAQGPEEAKLREGFAAVNSFNKTLDQLKEKVQNASKKDLANPYSNVSKQIKNDLRDLQLTYKGPAFAQLGVLAGPDLMILEDVIENPGSISNLFSGKKGVIDRYDQLKGRVNQNLETKLQSYGLEKEPTEEVQSLPQQAPAQGMLKSAAGLINKGAGLVMPEASASNKIRVSNGKEILLIEPRDLKDAEKDGFKVMK